MLKDQVLALGRLFCSGVDVYDKAIDFCEHIMTLMQCMENHDYEVEADKAFMWLYVASHQYYVRHSPCIVGYKKFIDLLVHRDYSPYPGAIVRDNLYWLFTQKCFVSPTHGAMLWNLYLTTGTEQEAKPNLSAYMTFAFLYKHMPVWYRKDLPPTETWKREAIFMALPAILGTDFCEIQKLP
jgi:hypothetical protein